MKKFFSRYSYDILKTFVFHLICGMFALTVISIVGSTDKQWWNGILSAFCILFYMFLIYGELWKLGDRDSVSMDKPSLLSGVYIALAGSALDFILAIMKLCIEIWGKAEGALQPVKAVFLVVNFVYNGIFRGVQKISVDGTELFSNWWVYFLTCVPALIACGLGYWFGRRGLHLTKIFIDENPEEKEVKREEKKRRKEERED